MTRYFFDFSNPEKIIADREGDELSDREAAEQLARTYFIERICEDLRQGKSPCDWLLTVRDGAGPVVLTLGFDDVVRHP